MIDGKLMDDIGGLMGSVWWRWRWRVGEKGEVEEGKEGWERGGEGDGVEGVGFWFESIPQKIEVRAKSC